jgi:serine/threonine-protein kinase
VTLARFSDFVAELKRRRVIRALLGWGVFSFAVLQVIEPVLHAYHLPEWPLTVVVSALGAGFPITAILAWVFDLTTKGITRTAPAASPEMGAVGPSGPRLAWLLLALGLLAAAPGLVYFFVWPGAGRRAAEARVATPAAPAMPSIAVLPFANLSSDKEQEYFSDGIAEEILNALAQVEGLRVIGRTSSFSMKGRSEDLRTIGQRLGTANLLEGSVRRSGARVRITAQLIEASGGSHLWSQEFDRELTDVFQVQEEIAHAVVAALKLKLLPAVREEQRIGSPAAHDQYLLGLAFLARGSGSAYARAVQALRRSVELDPGYAQAWAALARATFWSADQGSSGDLKVGYPQALAAAERAIELAPGRAEGYSARGLLRHFKLQDHAGARADMERALSLNPGSPVIKLELATLLASLGRLPEALATLQDAGALDPLSADIPAALSAVYLGTGQIALAEAAASRALDLSPENGRAARFLGFALLLQGRLPEARAAFHRSSNALFVNMGDVMVEHALGHADGSRKALDAILAQPNALGGAYQVAQIYAWRGEPDQAFEWLGRAVESHDAGLTYLKYDPFLRDVRGDVRYTDLLRKLKLPVE